MTSAIQARAVQKLNFGERSTTGAAPGARTLAPRPVLPLAERIALTMGLEALAAILGEQQSVQLRKEARAEQRAARDAQDAAVRRQVEAMHAKADATRKEGWIAGGLAVGGGVLSLTGVLTSGGAKPDEAPVLSRSLSVCGKTSGEASGPVSKLCAGADVLHHEAEATRHGADAKRAEAHAEEWGALMKQAEATIDKAHQALVSLQQARAQHFAAHGLYRPL